MVVNLQYLKKKYLKNFPGDEKLCNFVLTDVIFGFSEISEILKKNQKINSVLEIGSGSGILLYELKTFFPHINFIGIDPNESGYHSYRQIYESLDKREFKVENVQIEKFSTKENFDLIFSINVFEHVRDWKKYIDQTSSLLNDNGMNIIFAPNYDFPYEPHFVIPIIINKKITKFFFQRKFKKSEIKDKSGEVNNQISSIKIDITHTNNSLEEEGKKLQPLKDKKIENISKLQKINLEVTNLQEEEERIKDLNNKLLNSIKTINSDLEREKSISYTDDLNVKRIIE